MKCFIFIILVLLLEIAFSARKTPQNQPYNVNMNPDGTNPARYYGEWAGHSYFPSPSDWRKESIYQFITDRFADGDPTNNDGKYGGYNLYKVDMRHGGDLKGITNKLDYIKTLGFTTIWISPVFQNMENSYHGYAQIDFTVLDDRFGTLKEFREMVEQAHKRNIKVIVDIVTNHMADLLYFEGHQNSAAPFHLHSGEYKLLQRSNRMYEDFKINNTFVPQGQYCEVYNDQGVKIVDTGSGSYWDSDFHHNGDLRNYGDVYENHLGKIYGIMDDLRTSHPKLQDKLIAMTKALIASTDIDGIRMDTPMQQPLYFFKRWTPAVKEFASSLGKRNFFIFGEFYCTRERASTMTGRGKTPDMYGKELFIDNVPTMDSGIHYPLYYWFMETIKEQRNNLNGIIKQYNEDLSVYDFYNQVNRQNQYVHVHFFNNHDQWRMSAALDGFQKTDLSTAILALWPGILGYYYGDEQGFLTRGTALDGWSREDMMTSLAWKDLPTVNGSNPCEKDNFNMANPHYLWTKILLNLKRIYPALSGDQVFDRWEQPQNSNGIFSFTRAASANTNEWVLVAFNTWKDKLFAGAPLGDYFTGWKEGDVIVNALNPSERITLVANGKIHQLEMPAYGVKVFVKESHYKPLDLYVKHSGPFHDDVATSSTFTMTLEFSDDVDPNSVKNAITLNQNRVSPQVRGKYVGFQVTPRQGVNYVEVEEIVKSTKGVSMYGKFITRFRYGSNENIIINPRHTEDPKLVINFDGTTVTLKHKALGAEKFRVFLGESWSEWLDFEEITKHRILQGIRQLSVQYYVDNSAAYFVKTTF